MTTTDILLIVLGFLSIYNLIIYPAFLQIYGRLFPSVIIPDVNYLPDITIIISAYNEEYLIEGAIKSIRNSDYPQTKINIIVGSDGSTDKTNEILGIISKEDIGLTFYSLERGGKNKVLNTLVPLAETEIIMFMDADIRLNKNTIGKLAAYFSNEETGGVIASQKVVGDGHTINAGSEGDTLYHRYEENIRINEAVINSNVNSLGYLYGIKKIYFMPIPNDLVCDDLHNIYSVLRYKKRMLFADDAQAYEVRPKSLSNEFHRRIRAVSGGWATVMYHSELLNFFKYGITSFFVWSHKVFRWLTPVFMLMLLILTIFSSKVTNIFLLFFIAQFIIYSFALIGWIIEKTGIKIAFFRIFIFFIAMNYSSLLGLLRFLSKRQNAQWSREGFLNSIK